MLNLLICYAIAGACVLFMVSLPLGKMEVAGRLRRMSGALMLLAFAPYVFVDLVRALAHGAPHVVAPGGSTTGGGFLQVVGALALLAPVAYLILLVRKRLTMSPKDKESEWKHVRSSGKRPVERERHEESARSLFDDDEEES
jgi:hypothetical protein